MAIKQRVGRISVGIVMALIVFTGTMSITEKGAVRLRILYSGHPVTAMKAPLTRDYDEPGARHATCWVIPYRNSFLDSSGSYYETAFKIQRVLFFKYAIPVVPVG